MEVVYTEKLPKKFKTTKDKIIGIYGDILDLVSIGFDINGISYDDEWTVKRFLNGFGFKKKKNYISTIEYLEIDKNILNTKICNLSKSKFKFVLLAYLLINNKNIIIFDYFDVGLAYQDKRHLSKIIRLIKNDGYTSFIVSNDLVYLSTIVDKLMVIKSGSVVYDGSVSDYLSICEDNPVILDFIKKSNDMGAGLELTLDSRELLKDIYRRKS